MFAEPRLSADFGASYEIAKHYSLFASVKNLTDMALKYSEGTPDRLIQREFYGRTFEGGLDIKF